MAIELTNKQLKNILSLVIVIFIIYFVISLSLGKSKNLDGNNIKKQSYSGYIKEKFIDTTDHFANKIILKNGNNQPIHWKFSTYLEIGDSISKKEGDSCATIQKKDGHLIIYDLINNKIIDEK
ncbi:hypothetical protein [Flavobacterium chilense]|uniref:Uncharacterized protein n=1 Tax=Flavobacterium chilense TaxID=946677 RepID=A0A1M7N192_9FLAO|nr:hypothetical protein [Flavobacterium chilense]SHM97276.1 hypothetical protein SAMN05444484_11727 [Flavobacterium chilense]